MGQKNKDLVIVTGMHRSGTSALMRVCNLLGVEIGNNLFPAGKGNEQGFWEHDLVWKNNEKAFEVFSFHSQDIFSFPRGWESNAQIQEIKENIVSILKKDILESSLFGLKDPRISRLVPLWIEICADLSLTPRFIISFRDPVEVATSLVNRDGISFERGVLMWLLHNIEVEYHTRSFPRTFVYYPNIISRPQTEIEKISDALGIKWPRSFAETENDISAFLDEEARHNKNIDAYVPEIVSELFSVLKASDKGSLDTKAMDAIRHKLDFLMSPANDSVHQIIQCNKKLSSALSDNIKRADEAERSAMIEMEKTRHAEELCSENKRNLDNISAQLNAVLNSTSWRIMAPMRYLKKIIGG